MGWTREKGAILGGLGLLAPAVAAAQVPPGPAVQVPSSQRAVPTREQVEDQQVPASDRAGSRVALDVGGALPPGPCPFAEATIEVNIAVVRFEATRGGELPPEIVRILRPLTIVKPGPRRISTVCEVRDRANQALHAAGYVASVQIPAQEIAEGLLRLQVVTTRVVELRVTGVDGELSRDLAARVDAIRRLDPFNQREAERILLLARDVPGLALGLTLRPAGTEPGDVIAEIDVSRERVRLLGNYQNTGSRQLGRSLFSLRAEAYDLTGLADQTFVGVSQSSDWDEIHSVQGGHSFGLGSGGTRFGIRASYAESRPDIRDLDLRSRSLIAGLDLSTPLFRGLVRGRGTVDDVNLFAGTGLELLNQRSVIRQAGSSAPFTRDRLRVAYARLGGRTTSRDRYGTVIGDLDGVVEVRRGLDIFDATQRSIAQNGFNPSRFDGDPEAFQVRGTVNVSLTPLPQFDRLAFDLSAYGQWANRPLLNLEEFTIGNLTYGRGYDPGANAGDRALAFRIAPRLRVTAPSSDLQLDLTAFMEAIQLKNLDTDAGDERSRRLRSAGGGVRLSLRNKLALELTYARPLDRALLADDRNPTDRLLLSITTQFLPWSFGR